MGGVMVVSGTHLYAASPCFAFSMQLVEYTEPQDRMFWNLKLALSSLLHSTSQYSIATNIYCLKLLRFGVIDDQKLAYSDYIWARFDCSARKKGPSVVKTPLKL